MAVMKELFEIWGLMFRSFLVIAPSVAAVIGISYLVFEWSGWFLLLHLPLILIVVPATLLALGKVNR